MKYLNIENVKKVRQGKEFHDFIAEVEGVEVEYRLEIDTARYEVGLNVYIEGMCWDSMTLRGEALAKFHQALHRMEHENHRAEIDSRREEIKAIMQD